MADARVAVSERNTGIRKISRTTWRAGAVSLVVSGLLAGVFHETASTTSQQGGSSQSNSSQSNSSQSNSSQGNSSQGNSSQGNSSQGNSSQGNSGQGSIVIPAQPPSSSSGSSQVISGAS